MPVGPWASFDACMADPKLRGRYPDEAARRRVCGAVKARLEADAASEARSDAGRMAGRVTRGAGWAIVHDVVAAVTAPNAANQVKPWEELVAAAATLEGAPLVYGGGARGHPVDASGELVIFTDPREAAGLAVNVRADGARRRLLYDALLFLEAPQGSRAEAVDLARNAFLADHVDAGGTVDNSVGYTVAFEERGDGGATVQRGLRFGHVAILRPFAPQRGKCTAPSCGFGVDADGCGGGDGHCCRTRMEAAVGDLQASGLTRLQALALVRDAGKRS